jgi:hypothetical protein
VEPLAADPYVGHLWRPIADSLEAALTGGEQSGLARAAHDVGRALALTREVRLPDLLDDLTRGMDRLQAAAGEDIAAFVECRTVVERSLAEGFAEGLEETVTELRHQTDDLSPADPFSGVLRPRQTNEQLGLELQRCERMDLPIGVAAVQATAGEAWQETEGAEPPAGQDIVGRVLRENLRRYDGLGSLEDGRHVLFLPGASRDGLLTAVERLHRLLDEDPRTAAGPPAGFILLHLDCADLPVADILTTLREGRRNVPASDYLAWA